ncbi:5-guanidino-2-oxopentanoate decarboxylase [Cochlodiniinecator piscidefendens]|uniref:5-guanidino-2-oxopentanoate decarboxylase n=1 Tax=Cochlodiniinecator piscidefendens TaxID=2715756 RepID=UPI00140735B4|nr:5-guanidino-2-oxopentanoate decarboxylase [Cochlodiniinecator piscidefendens]
MIDKPLGAQLSHMLKDRGVEVIFGIPGVHNVELYRGIEEAGIKHVLARHEQGAGFMADGYARATGKVGVAYLITGPGLCNAMTPMGQGYSDSVSMLVLSSCLERKDRSIGRGRLHEMKDQEGAAATVCDWSVTAPDAPAAYRLVDKALSELKSSRPRPKHIQVPIDVLGERAPAAPAAAAIAQLPIARPDDVERVAQMMRDAKRPMFLFGGGAVAASAEARKVVEQAQAAVFTTFAGRGVVAGSYPLNYGAYLPRPDSASELAKADLLLCVGTELAEVDLWRDDLGHRCPMVRVDIDTHCLADDFPADLPILGDAKVFLSELSGALGTHSTSEWREADVKAAKARFYSEVDAERPGIAQIAQAMQDALPEDTMYYSDMTQFAYVAKEVVEMERAGHWHHPYAFGTLGYALPAAIGGKVGRGDGPVVAIAGDYGFHYTMQELGAAVELGLNMPIVLWDNAKLKEIEDAMVRSQIAPNAVVAYNPDFCKLAEAFGAYAEAPKSLEDFKSALQNALKADKPTLVYATPEMLG